MRTRDFSADRFQVQNTFWGACAHVPEHTQRIHLVLFPDASQSRLLFVSTGLQVYIAVCNTFEAGAIAVTLFMSGLVCRRVLQSLSGLYLLLSLSL